MQREPQPDRFGLLASRGDVRPGERRRHHPHRLGPEHLVEALAVEPVADGGPGAELGGERGGGHGVGPGAVAGPADRGGRVDGDRDARHPVLPRERPPAGAALGVHPGRVDDGGQPPRHPSGDDLVEQRERVGARGDVVLARADDAAQRVRRDDGRGREVRRGPRRLPRRGRTRQHHQARRREQQRHGGELGVRPPPPATRGLPDSRRRDGQLAVSKMKTRRGEKGDSPGGYSWGVTGRGSTPRSASFSLTCSLIESALRRSRTRMSTSIEMPYARPSTSSTMPSRTTKFCSGWSCRLAMSSDRR